MRTRYLLRKAHYFGQAHSDLGKDAMSGASLSQATSLLSGSTAAKRPATPLSP